MIQQSSSDIPCLRGVGVGCGLGRGIGGGACETLLGGASLNELGAATVLNVLSVLSVPIVIGPAVTGGFWMREG